MKGILERNNVNISGNGDKVILFANGFGCDQNAWRFIIDAFKGSYKCILFDYVGSGQSDLSYYNRDRYGNLRGYAEDILEICAELNLSDAIFVGHSVSSMIGILASIDKPSIFSKIIMVGPSPRYLNDEGYKGGFEKEDLEGLFDMMDSNYLGWSRFLAPTIMGNPDKPELGESLTNSFCATDPEIAKEFARVTFFSDNRADLPKLKIPSLTLQCAEDIIAPVEVGEYINRNTPGNSLVYMKATGHCPHMSAPEETIQAIKSFIE